MASTLLDGQRKYGDTFARVPAKIPTLLAPSCGRRDLWEPYRAHFRPISTVVDIDFRLAIALRRAVSRSTCSWWHEECHSIAWDRSRPGRGRVRRAGAL